MCCQDPPPDLNLLGPPPRPPWLSYALHCGEDGIVLQHEGQTAALPNSGGGALFNNRTVNTVAIVLFCLAALFLVITLFVIWQRRRFVQKQQIDHGELPDENQYLYNYKIRGKLWRLPKVTMVLSKLRKSHDEQTESSCHHKPDHDDEMKQSITNSLAAKQSYNTDTLDTGFGDDTSITHLHGVYKGNNYVSGSQRSNEPSYRFSQSHNKPYSSLERGSSTTSGFSSDGEWRYQEDSVGSKHLEQDSSHSRKAKKLRRKGHREKRQQDDGDLGDAEGSLECLAPVEKRLSKPPKKYRPNVPSTEDDVLFIKHHNPHTPPSSINNKKGNQLIQKSPPVQNAEENVPRTRKRTQEFKITPPKVTEQALTVNATEKSPDFEECSRKQQTSESVSHPVKSTSGHRIPAWASGVGNLLLKGRDKNSALEPLEIANQPGGVTTEKAKKKKVPTATLR